MDNTDLIAKLEALEAPMRDKVAKAIVDGLRSNAVFVGDNLSDCEVDGGLFDMRDVADAAIAAILAELETPSVEMCRAAIAAWDNKAVKSDEAGMAAAIQAVAAHVFIDTGRR